ncbi:MAG: ATP-binding protein [Roseiarcus sp.]
MALARIFRATAFKLTLAILGLSAIGSGIVLGIVAWQVIKVVDDETAQTIDAEASGLSEQYQIGGIRRLGTVVEARSREPSSTIYLLTDSAGEPLAGNIGQLPQGVLDQPGFVDTPYQSSDDAGHPRPRRALARIFKLPGGFRLLVGHDLGDRARIGAVMVRALAMSLIFLAGVAALGALFVARRVLRRIDAMNRSAHAIMAGDLAERLPVSGSGDELDRLAVGLNQMLARIADLMTGLREVSDNIAHDLRTPLTRLRNHAEDALRAGGDSPNFRAALERTIEESDGLIRIFDALLMIARAEAGAATTSAQKFDVGVVVSGVAELYEPVAEERGFDLAVRTEPDLEMSGNRELVGQAVANLVDNALKYGAPTDAGGARAVAIEARREGAEIVITVADKGPGVAEADRERIFDRFVRLEGARTRPGSGLGLSLAAAAARMHGGRVSLADNKPGLEVVVRLPAVEAA